MLADGWLAVLAAAVVPLLVVLTIGLHGVALALGWLVLTIVFLAILAEHLPGRWGPAQFIGSIALSSLLAAIVVVSLIGR